jgi:protein-S-isoprenylcysteine O-methyltransferase Ste14
MPTTTLINLYGPALLIILALVWGFARILYLRRRDGVSVLAVLGRRRSLVERLAALVAILLDSYLLARPFVPKLDTYVQATHYSDWGVLVMALGIGIAVLSQVDMGRSWRIGVPEGPEESQELVTGGLYQFSRNPIYVGIMIFLLGGVILVPGPVTIGSTLATWALVEKIIRDEERFLHAAFGDAYAAYCSRVRRWL